MTRWLAVLIPLFLAMALMLGWSFPGRPEEPLGVTRGGATIRGLTLRPGESTTEAVRFLRTLRSDPPPPYIPPPPTPPPPPPPPPPPDVAVTFAAALRAIEREPGTERYQALISDPAAPGPQTRAIVIGDAYGDGWRINAISADSVSLVRGRETRRVRLYR
ncbi:hypothetical protein [Brevundimonas variabilis]|uniref:Type II secretion system protein GspC N-terminal domain-containing protein n=1 Tax=Brevundimonas variabilis TaxID=74312 RepID=A0A7W9CGP6_9CAUL|nr:hypothetical protein [Brevundimonas variabilis]MBB5745329.1 hypothetical protein [Brevundimonas variabilis]